MDLLICNGADEDIENNNGERPWDLIDEFIEYNL